MKKTQLILLILCLCGHAFAQVRFDIQSIPDSLRKDANSVVRQNSIEFTYRSQTQGTQTETLVISILNNKGNEAANFNCYCDKFRELKKFSGEIYSANGTLLRKIKRSELIYSEYSFGLASDGKTYYLDCNVPTYPYTVKYEWEVENRNGIIGFPTFLPQNRWNQSIQEATYRLVMPNAAEIKYKALNMPEKHIITADKDNLIREWSIKDLTAFISEPAGPELISLIPRLYITPIRFSYDGSTGDISNWNSFGLWQYKLLEGRDILPEILKIKLREMVKKASTDREKVKIIYDYLAETTRYVSIQLGIGGLQPIPAAEVSATGFGDCKGLSNYMGAMLKEIGIPSNYTIISTERKELIKDFSSANQMNHVILHVPLPGDTLWLECTNPKLPFGYIHRTIAGHDALLVTKNGGILCRLPSYPDSLNVETNSVELRLSDNGSVSARVKNRKQLFRYESNSYFTKLTPQKQAEELRSRLDIPQANITNIIYKEEKNAVPWLSISYDIHSLQYGSRTGSRLFIPLNSFRKIGKAGNRKKRYGIYSGDGYRYCDTIIITIPDTYEIESIAKPTLIQEDFGTFQSDLKNTENTITIIQTLSIKTGEYPASAYPSYTEFLQTVADCYNSKLVLRKKTE